MSVCNRDGTSYWNRSKYRYLSLDKIFLNPPVIHLITKLELSFFSLLPLVSHRPVRGRRRNPLRRPVVKFMLRKEPSINDDRGFFQRFFLILHLGPPLSFVRIRNKTAVEKPNNFWANPICLKDQTSFINGP